MSDEETQPDTTDESGGLPIANEDAIQIGSNLGSALLDLNSDDAEKKATAQSELAQTIGAAVASAGSQAAQKKLQKRQNAKQTSEKDISVVEDYPSCPNCSEQLTEVPNNGEFQCGNCGVTLQIN